MTAFNTTRFWGRAGLAGVGLAAFLVVFSAGLALRLFLGPVSLGPFAGDLRDALDHVLPGLVVRFDNAALAWSPEEERFNLLILGTRVFDENQHIIAQAPEAEIGLAAGPFLRGHIVVRRIALVGVQLTLVHTKSGILRLGMGGGRNQNDVLEKIRDAIAHSDQGGSALNSFAVEKARLAVLEEETGMFVVAPDANLQIATAARQGTLRATVSARVEIAGHPSRIEAALSIPAHGEDISGDFSVSGLSPRSLAANTKFFSFLEPFDLTTELTGSFTLAHGTTIARADFGIGAHGTVNGAGPPIHVRAFTIAGRYDGATNRLLIDDATLQGVQAHAHMEGTGDVKFDAAGSLSQIALDLRLDRIGFDLPAVMGKSVSLARASLRASYTRQTSTIAIDQALVFGGPLSARLNGTIVLAGTQSPAIMLDGSIAAIAVREMLHYWPLQVAPGARAWIDDNVSDGRIGPMTIHTRIPAGGLDQPVLADNTVALHFPIEDATISYIHGLTPLTQVLADATLSGDTFAANVPAARIGPLQLADGRVFIPNLHVHGTQGLVNAHVIGTVGDVLALIDQKPLQYAKRFHIRRASAKGQAAVDLAIRVPMLHDVSVDDVGISVRVATSGFGLALNDRATLSNGAVNFLIDNSQLRAVGNVTLGTSANLGIDWSETFKPHGPYSSHVHVNGVLDEASREQIGIRIADYVSGPVGVNGILDGLRGTILHAQVKLDLTPAVVSLKTLGYRKPAGTPVQAQLIARLDPSGTLRSADVTAAGNLLAAHGTAHFYPAGDIQSLVVPSFRSGNADDVALTLTRSPDKGLAMSIDGHSFDATNLLARDSKTAGANDSGKTERTVPEAFHISAKLDRVVLREGVALSSLALDAAGQGSVPGSFAMNAALSKTASLTGGIANGDGGKHLRIAAGDAGLIARGLFGFTSVKGGTLALDVQLPAAAKTNVPPPDYSGTLTLSKVTIVNQPFLTRLFSAGSFDGLADLMRGQGIVIDKLDVPFAVHGAVLDIHDLRAAGPSVGITADGYYDLRSNQIALQGALVPVYGINSVLGSIPVLGNVFVSKKGEGVFGVTYSVSGDADQPNVSVNPLSVLAPGILRRLFLSSIPTAPAAPALGTPPASGKAQ